MKLITALLFYAALGALSYFALYEQSPGAGRLYVFCIWFMGVGVLAIVKQEEGGYEEYIKKVCEKSHNEKGLRPHRHMPPIFYAASLVALCWFGWWFTMFPCFIIATHAMGIAQERAKLEGKSK